MIRAWTRNLGRRSVCSWGSSAYAAWRFLLAGTSGKQCEAPNEKRASDHVDANAQGLVRCRSTAPGASRDGRFGIIHPPLMRTRHSCPMNMFRSLPPILLAALASACATATVPRPDPSVPAEPQPNGRGASDVTARPARTLAQVQGEWDIVEFDGYRPPRLNTDGLRNAYVDIGAGGMRFAIGCNYSGMPGSVGSDGVLITAVPDTGMTTQMGCGPEREARDTAFFNFFRSRPQVTLLSDGRLRIEGTSHSLLLERAGIRRLAYGPPLPEIMGTWRVVSFTRFVDGGYHGWGAMFAPGRLRIDPSAITYSRCPALRVSFRYTADFTLFRDSPDQMPSGLCSAAKPAPTEVELLLATLLGQSPHAERVPGGGFVLRSRDYAVLLASEADYRRRFGQEAVEWERRPG